MVEQLTFNADGTYETFNPETGGTRESGTYSISADDKYRNMRPTGGPDYRCRIQFKGQDAFEDWQQLVNTTLAFSFTVSAALIARNSLGYNLLSVNGSR